MATFNLTPAPNTYAILTAATVGTLPDVFDAAGCPEPIACELLALATLYDALQGTMTDAGLDRWFASYAAALATGTAGDLLELADCSVEWAIRDAAAISAFEVVSQSAMPCQK